MKFPRFFLKIGSSIENISTFNFNGGSELALILKSGDRSGSVRFLFMKTSQTLRMTLRCYDLVKKAFQMIHFIIKSQKTGWIYQSLALFVFLTTGQALLTRKVTFMVSLKYKLPLCVNPRLGTHRSPRHIDRQAARDCDSHRPKQQLHRENEPDWKCRRKSDCVRRRFCRRTL